MLQNLRRGLIVITAFSVAVASAAGPAGAADPSSAQTGSAASAPAQLSPDVARKAKGTDPAARNRVLTEYWTPERMRNARPMETVLRETVKPTPSGPGPGSIAPRSLSSFHRPPRRSNPWRRPPRPP